MLMLTIGRGEKVLFYLRTEHGEKLLGGIIATEKQRIAFDFGQEIHVMRAKADEKRKAETIQ